MSKIHLIISLIVAYSFFSCSISTEKKSNKNQIPVKTDSKTTNTFKTEEVLQFAMDGNIEKVKDAVNGGFNVNSIDANKRTALMMASYNGHTDIVNLLIDNGADVNIKDVMDRTALMFASTGPFTPTVLSLLKAGANPNMIDNEEKWTAVMMAASEGQLEVVKTLVAYGADLKMVDIDNESSLDFAKSKGHNDVVMFIESKIK